MNTGFDRLLHLCSLILVLCATAAHAQPAFVIPTPPSFDEASVTRSHTAAAEARIELPAGDRFVVRNVTVHDLAAFAYDIQGPRLLGGPEWIRSERFDIDARAGHPFPQSTTAGPPVPLLLMVRSLLADRFGLAVHQETRELPALALAVFREDRMFGPGITASKLECDTSGRLAREASSVSQERGPLSCGVVLAPGRMFVGGASMAQFATILSDVVGRVVIDRTDLPGTFDFRLSWPPAWSAEGPPADGRLSLTPDDESLTAALREQLGLTVESIVEPLDVLVIDSVTRPDPD